MQNISENFPITTMEYKLLDEKFGKLCHYASWQLNKKNSKNNHTDDPEDTVQELRIALLRAGSYYKRQVYIESSFDKVLELLGMEKYIDKKDREVIRSRQDSTGDPFLKQMVKNLWKLWINRKRHGANRQKFGVRQEQILDTIMFFLSATKEDCPNKNASLRMDGKFTTYCKQIIWNAQKQMGKKITREKSWRTGLVSLSEFDYLAGVAG